MHLDVLKEVGNIGAGNAATSLSEMLTKPINMSVPEIKILDYNDAVNSMGGPENAVVGILVKLEDDIDGIVMFLLEQDFVHLVLNSLTGSTVESFEQLSEMDISALSEIGNIMVSSYVNAIAQLANMKINISVPSLSIDMVGAILSVCAVEFAEVADKVIFIQEKFDLERKDVDSYMLLIPSMGSLNILLQRLGLEL